MNKWLTCFVPAVLALTFVKVKIRDADSVPSRALRQTDDRVTGTERAIRRHGGARPRPGASTIAGDGS